MQLDLDTVTQLLEELIEQEVFPVWGKLRADQIERKSSEEDPDDVVSVVDKALEAALTPRLKSLWPGSGVVGEEATHENPALLKLLHGQEPTWVIDPIDGTRGFVRGEAAFGVMVALVLAQRAQAAWIALPAQRQMFVAERGQGTWLNAERVRCAEPAPGQLARGTLYTRYLAEPQRTTLERVTAGRYNAVSGAGSAAVEYTDVAQGKKEFVVYHRLLPWDHVPGALIVQEAGGCVRHADGSEYAPQHSHGPLVVSATHQHNEQVRGWLAVT